MRVAIVTYGLNVGGVEAVLLCLARRLVANGAEVEFFETTAVGEWAGWFRSQGFVVNDLTVRPWESRAAQVRRLGRELRRFEAVILNDAPVGQATAGILSDSQVVLPVIHLALRTMIRNAGGNLPNTDRLVAVSPAVMNSALKYGIPAEALTCIPNGVDVPESWPAGKSIRETTEAGLRVVFVGRLEHRQKGILHIPVIAKLAVTGGAEGRIDVIGDGPDRRSLVAALGGDASAFPVVVHGALPHPRTIETLRAADVLLMPSYFEGLPIALLEAMATGVVPVVSRLAGCTDYVVTDGVSGLLVEPGDEEGFADGLVSLARDRDRLRALSEAAWRRAHDRFSSARMAESYLGLVEELQQKRNAGPAHPRSGTIDMTLLGDLPHFPSGLVRPLRKILRLMRLMPPPMREPAFFEWDQAKTEGRPMSSDPAEQGTKW